MKKEYGEMKNRWSSESKVEHAHTLPSRERGRANTLKEKIFFPSRAGRMKKEKIPAHRIQIFGWAFAR